MQKEDERMSKGHANIAAIGTAALNKVWKTDYKSILRRDDSHAEVAILKNNLKEYRAHSSEDWTSIQEILDVLSEIFDEHTEQNLIQFQKLEDLNADGIYGQSSRNRMAAKIGVSPKGFVRLDSPAGGAFINFNDTKDGMAKDKDFLLDHSWLTKEALNTVSQLADSFRKATSSSKILEINDCSLIDGEDTPEHESHQTGTIMDIRNSGMTAEEEKKFLEICTENAQVKKVLFHKKYDIASDKIKPEPKHHDHFHIEIG